MGPRSPPHGLIQDRIQNLDPVMPLGIRLAKHPIKMLNTLLAQCCFVGVDPHLWGLKKLIQPFLESNRFVCIGKRLSPT